MLAELPGVHPVDRARAAPRRNEATAAAPPAHHVRPPSDAGRRLPTDTGKRNPTSAIAAVAAVTGSAGEAEGLVVCAWARAAASLPAAAAGLAAVAAGAAAAE